MRKNRIFIVILLIFLFLCNSCKDPRQINPIPESTRQLILVVTAGADSSKGIISCFERNNEDAIWHSTRDIKPIILGRSGLAWGRGLQFNDTSLLKIKVEGDGHSPAGVYHLGEAFGFYSPDEITPTKYPYFQIAGKLECIDDPTSTHYNTIVDREKIVSVDWTSSERMYRCHGFYDLGIIVEHNTTDIIKGGGSCIFLHIWTGPEDATSGCTTMSQEMMEWLIGWLDPDKEPVLVQLPRNLYEKYLEQWRLPRLD